MFYGQQLKSNTAVKLSKDGELLHLSQVCLNNPKANGKTYVQVIEGNNSYNIACLEKDKNEQATIDIFIHTAKDMKIKTVGAANDVDVVGFFEPASPMIEETEVLNGSSSKKRQPETPVYNDSKASKLSKKELGDIKSSLLKKMTGKSESDEAKQDSGIENVDDEDNSEGESDDNELLDVEAEEDDEDDDEDEDDEDADEEEEDVETDDDLENEDELDDDQEDDDEDDDEDDEEDDEEEDEDDDSGTKQNKTPVSNNKVKNDQPKASVNQKSPEKAKAATDNKKSFVSNDIDTKFVTSLKQFLKENGKTNIGLLGSKVKKPAEIKEKLGIFLKARPAIFNVENETVSLKA